MGTARGNVVGKGKVTGTRTDTIAPHFPGGHGGMGTVPRTRERL